MNTPEHSSQRQITMLRHMIELTSGYVARQRQCMPTPTGSSRRWIPVTRNGLALDKLKNNKDDSRDQEEGDKAVKYSLPSLGRGDPDQ
jgi:hypothetical protein